MSVIRITTLSMLFILLTTLPSQPTHATASNAPEQFSCANVTEIPQIECEALVALYNGTDGPNWKDTTGWLVTDMPCSWYGVSCSERHITELRLSGDMNEPFGLQGALPAEIGNLTNLITIDLSSNQLSNLPAEIGNLVNLTWLYLFSNQLSSLPAEIGNLTNLIWLHLSDNRLSSLPTEIGSLDDLTRLELASNRLSSLPEEISNLTDLTRLDLAYNRLVSLDDSLHSLVAERSPDWASTQTVALTDVKVTALEVDSIELTWTPIAFQEKGGYYEISVANGDWYIVHGITEHKSVNRYMIDGLTGRTTYAIRIRTYTPPHDGNPDISVDNQRNELWSDSVRLIATTLDPDSDDDDCNRATEILSGEILPESRLDTPLDIDWYIFQAVADTSYRIAVDIPSGSKADVNLELYPSCDSSPSTSWAESFAPGVQLDFTPANDGPLYLRLVNADDSVGGPDWRYQLSIRQLNPDSKTSAVIIVAGRLRHNDHLQDNIYAVTDRVFNIFQREGYTTDDIYYLAPEADKVVHHDKNATVNNVKEAITDWAVKRLQAEDVPDVLTIFMMDHGGIDELYLDGPSGEVLRPTELDKWLDDLEELVPGVLINVIIEACHAGSFIQEPGSISGPNRVVVTSSDQENDAYASHSGATFSDQFLTSLQRGDSLHSSWSQAKDVVADLFMFRPQRPWINGDGDTEPNEPEDFIAASGRGFAYAGTLGGPNEPAKLWPPYIAQTIVPEQSGRNEIIISAEVRDDRGVNHVWAIIYPPIYIPPIRDSQNELIDGEDETLERILLDHKGDGIYRGRAYSFTDSGTYRIVIHADDADGLLARPVVLEYSHDQIIPIPDLNYDKYVYLPYISR